MIVWKLTSLLGEPLGRLNDTRGGKVTIPRNNDRSGSVQISLHDRAVAAVEPLAVLLKAYIPGRALPVFAGPIYTPAGIGAEGLMELRAKGPSLRLEKAPLIRPRSRFHSLDQLVNRARPKHYGGNFTSDPEDPDAIPDHGIKKYSGPRRGPMPRMDISLGQDVWQTILRASSAENGKGPDFDLRPIEHEPGTWDYCEMDIWEDRGEDRTDLTFHYGWGRENLVDFQDEPAGDLAVNLYFAGVTKPNQDETGEDAIHLRKWKSLPELRRYGLYADYEAVEGCAKPGAQGIATIAAYREPPHKFEITLAAPEDVADGAGQPPVVFDDFDVGDLIKAVAKKGYWERSLTGKVTQIELEDDDQGITRPTITVVPATGIDGIDEELIRA